MINLHEVGTMHWNYVLAASPLISNTLQCIEKHRILMNHNITLHQFDSSVLAIKELSHVRAAAAEAVQSDFGTESHFKWGHNHHSHCLLVGLKHLPLSG